MMCAVLAAAAALASGCGGSSSSTATTTAHTTTSTGTLTSTTTTQTTAAPTQAQLGARYLAIVGPMYAAIAKANSRAQSATTVAEVQAAYSPMIPALQTGTNLLLRMGLTGQAATDVRALVGADSQLIAAIQSGDFANLTTILGSRAAAVSEVRADLGLPPAKPAFAK
jgi:hypothetical protein